MRNWLLKNHAMLTTLSASYKPNWQLDHVIELVNWLRCIAIFNNCPVISRQQVHRTMCFLASSHTVIRTTVLPSNWLLFHNALLANWRKTNGVCSIGICQTLERMVAQLGFELTTHRHTNTFLRPCRSRVLTSWWQNEKELMINEFSFCHNVFSLNPHVLRVFMFF